MSARFYLLPNPVCRPEVQSDPSRRHKNFLVCCFFKNKRQVKVVVRPRSPTTVPPQAASHTILGDVSPSKNSWASIAVHDSNAKRKKLHMTRERTRIYILYYYQIYLSSTKFIQKKHPVRGAFSQNYYSLFCSVLPDLSPVPNFLRT